MVASRSSQHRASDSAGTKDETMPIVTLGFSQNPTLCHDVDGDTRCNVHAYRVALEPPQNLVGDGGLWTNETAVSSCEKQHRPDRTGADSQRLGRWRED